MHITWHEYLPDDVEQHMLAARDYQARQMLEALTNDTVGKFMRKALQGQMYSTHEIQKSLNAIRTC